MPRRATRAIIAHAASVGTGGGGIDGGPDPAAHGAKVMLFVSRVTAPFLASALPPVMFAPVVRVMLVSAMRLPMNDVVVQSVAELPICQATPHGLPPLIS